MAAGGNHVASVTGEILFVFNNRKCPLSTHCRHSLTVKQRTVSTAASDFDYSSPTVPDAALFVAADEPLLVFPSAKAAERSLEAIDVENGVYSAAYGPKGEPYRIASTGSEVVIERTAGPDAPENLKTLLVQYLHATERPCDPDAPLETLVAAVWKIESDFWQENDPYGDRFSKPVPRSCCVAVVLILATLLYVLITRHWTAIPLVILMTLLIGGIAALAKRKADRLEFGRR